MIVAARFPRITLRRTLAALALASLVPVSAAGQNIWDDPAFALYRQGARALEHAAQFPDTKEQAAREIQKVRAGAGGSTRSSRPGLPR